jgi:integrase
MPRGKPLTDAAVRALKPRAGPYKASDTHGLFVLVTPAGGKLWRYKYRLQGREKLMALGDFDDGRGVTLAEARRRRDAARALVKKGIDPMAERAEGKARAKVEAASPFEKVARRWLEARRGALNARTYATKLARLEANIFPALGAIPLARITRADVLAAVAAVERRGVKVLAKRLLQDVKAVFEYGAVHGLCEGDPTFGIGKTLAGHREVHRPHLQPPEIPPFLEAWRGYRARVYPTTARAMEFLMLTFPRPGAELIAARWGEIDWGKAQWRIPEARLKVKGRGDHIVPLSKQALAILKAQWADTMAHLYGLEPPQDAGAARDKVTKNAGAPGALGAPVENQGLNSGFSAPGPGGTGGISYNAPDTMPLANASPAAKLANLLNSDPRQAFIWPSLLHNGGHMSGQTLLQVLRRMGWGERIVPHGFRGTAATALGELGYDRNLIDLQLAHAEQNKVTAAYNHAERMPERRAMMERWGVYLGKLGLPSEG